MLDTLRPTSQATADTAIWKDVRAACDRMPPLWDLENYVAVNPFIGFALQPIGQAIGLVEEGLGAHVLPSLDFYRRQWTKGEFGSPELHAAARRAGIDPHLLESVLSDPADQAAFRVTRPVLTFAERHDRAHGSEWRQHTLRSIARWCAVYASNGGPQWSNARRDGSLFTSWLEASRVDRSLEIIGLRGWREWMRQVPERPQEAIAAMLARLEIPEAGRVEYFYRLLGGLFGWASLFRRSSWQRATGAQNEVADLLAILVCADAGIWHLGGKTAYQAEESQIENESIRITFQEALEDKYIGGVIASLNPPVSTHAPNRPAVQAIFCIDVRSEPLRRHLEAQSDSIETRGFAGFFGVSLDWQPVGGHSARCPVLLKPSVALRPPVELKPPAMKAVTNHMQYAPSAAFSFVEMLGLTYGFKLASDAMVFRKRARAIDQIAPFELLADDAGHGLTLKDQVELAAGILKNTGLGSHCARLVLLCGHVGHSANNPHAAGLDCGACGGHGGAINARVAASLLNAPAVRQGLADREIELPVDTHFLPAVHDTSVDRVTLLDAELIPPTHREDVAELQTWLARAGGLVRQERAAGLGASGKQRGVLDRLLHRRSQDWSEVRPEWGLARNACFIAARRARSRGVDLEGRAFLHEYDAASDTDGSVLTLILSAPMVVASWINLQYFASTVDNEVFGCGNKALHNRIGSLGVVIGNGGDLRTGLATQSVHAPDGSWYHEPLRLQVIVESHTEQIDRVLAAQPAVRALVENGWVRLFSLNPLSGHASRRVAEKGWEPVLPHCGDVEVPGSFIDSTAEDATAAPTNGWVPA